MSIDKDFDNLEVLESINYKENVNKTHRRYSIFAEFDPLYKKAEVMEESRNINALNIEMPSSNKSLNQSIPRKLKKNADDLIYFGSSPMSLEATDHGNESTQISSQNMTQLETDSNYASNLQILDEEIYLSKKSKKYSLDNSITKSKHQYSPITRDETPFSKFDPARCENFIDPQPMENTVDEPSREKHDENTRNDTGLNDPCCFPEETPSLDHMSAKMSDLVLENNELRHVITMYEESSKNIEALIAKIIYDTNLKCENIKQKCQKSYDEIHNLDTAYKYTYNRYEELKKLFDTQKDTEAKLLKSNTDLRKGVELAGSQINELLKEANDSKVNYESEISRLQTSLKLNTVKISGLEKNIEELTRQKEELTLICEEFLNVKE